MNDETIKKSVQEIRMPQEVKQRIARQVPNAAPIHKRSGRRFVAALAAACICLLIAVPALASSVEPVYQMVYAISPAAAQYFQKVAVSDTSDGICMEVDSAFIHGDTAEVYITMQDLTEDRIDETIDLFDSYDIHIPFDNYAHCERVAYDSAARKATFHITITTMHGEAIEGGKVTFSVREFLSHKKYFQGLLPEADLSAVSSAPETVVMDQPRGGGGDFTDKTLENGVVLAPSEQPFSPCDGVTITAIGYLAPNLHVQARYNNILETDNHGFLFLKGREGQESVLCNGSKSFWDEAHRDSIEEYYFKVPYDELSDYQLYGDFQTCDTLVEGSWRVTFRLENME